MQNKKIRILNLFVQFYYYIWSKSPFPKPKVLLLNYNKHYLSLGWCKTDRRATIGDQFAFFWNAMNITSIFRIITNSSKAVYIYHKGRRNSKKEHHNLQRHLQRAFHYNSVYWLSMQCDLLVIECWSLCTYL